MLDYLMYALNRFISVKGYIVYIFVQKLGRESWFIEYLMLFLIIYLVLFWILHRIYRFFVGSTNKQKERFYFDADNVLYYYQLDGVLDNRDMSRISSFVSKKSYEQSYNIVLDNAKKLPDSNIASNLEKSYKSFINSKLIKKTLGLFLSIFSFGLYYIFIEK